MKRDSLTDGLKPSDGLKSAAGFKKSASADSIYSQPAVAGHPTRGGGFSNSTRGFQPEVSARTSDDIRDIIPNFVFQK